MNGSNIKMLLVSSFVVEAKLLTDTFEIEKYNGSITSVNYDSGSISLFNPVKFKDGKHIIKPRYIIQDENYPNKFNLYQDKTNITNSFILPLLFEDQFLIDFHDKILNVYCGITDTVDLNKELSINDDGLFFIVYRYFGTPAFLKYENKVQKHKFCKGVLDIDCQHIAFVIDSNNNKYHDDIRLIQQGKYSRISLEAKERIINYFLYYNFIQNNSKETSKIYSVLYRTDLYKRILEKKLNVKIPNNVDLFEFYNFNKEHYYESFMKITDDERNKFIGTNGSFEESGR